MDMSDEEEERVRKEFERIKNQRTASDEDRDTVLNHEDDIKQKSLTGALKKFSADIGDLLEMIKAYYKKEYTTSRYNLNPARFSAIGYGEYRPIAMNDTPENKQQNRRVEILIARTLAFNPNEGVYAQSDTDLVAK